MKLGEDCKGPGREAPQDVFLRAFQACLGALSKWTEVSEATSDATFKRAADTSIVLLAPTMGSVAGELGLRHLKTDDRVKAAEYFRFACVHYQIAMPAKVKDETAEQRTDRENIEKALAVTNQILRREYNRNCGNILAWLKTQPTSSFSKR